MFTSLRSRIYDTMLECSRDDDPGVKSSALRTLGVLVCHDPFRSDASLLCLVADVLPGGIQDSNINVRIRAGWTLANVCDSPGAAAFDVDRVAELLRLAMHAAGDNEKCRPSGVRAIGNAIRSAPLAFITRFAESDVREAALTVLRHVDTGPVKARWNAVHALGSLLRSAHLDLGRVTWRAEVVCRLAGAAAGTGAGPTAAARNFKVRIGAAAALQAVRSAAGVGGAAEARRLADELTCAATALGNNSTAAAAAAGGLVGSTAAAGAEAEPKAGAPTGPSVFPAPSVDVGFGELRYKVRLQEQ
ncbi:HEAT repeat-containing protein 6, partial [Cladochytrium tenue]